MTYEEFKANPIHAFPPAPFTGVITNNCRCDECDALRHQLPGKRWDEIPDEFIDFNSASLPVDGAGNPESLFAGMVAQVHGDDIR